MGARRTSGIRAFAAVAALAALVATGCSSPPPEQPAAPPTSRVVVSAVGELTSFNPASRHGDTDANRAVAQYLGESFAYVDDELQVAVNDGFGRVELVSEDPLQVIYTLHEGRSWSDGQPVTLDDLIFGWAVASGYFDDATYDDQGAVVSGTRYFDIAAAPAGYRETLPPRVNLVKRTLTLTYEEPFADWNRLWLLDRPVHVVAEKAGLSVDEIMAAIRRLPKGDPAAPAEPDPVLLAAAQAWNTGFDVDPAAPDLTAAVSNGPYTARSWSENELILERNPEYRGQHEPSFDELVIRFYDTPADQLAALQRGEVDVANIPDATPAVVDALTDAGLTVLPGERTRALSLIFSDTGVWADEALRDAAIAAIDRDALVADTAAPVDPDAAPLRSFLTTPAWGDVYREIVAGNGSGDLPAPDPDRVRELVDAGPVPLRLSYDEDDPFAGALAAHVRRMLAQAGVVVTAAETPDAADASIVEIDTGRSLYTVTAEWTASGTVGRDGAAAFRALRESLDPELAVEFAQRVDATLIEERHGLPLIAVPGVVAYSPEVAGVSSTGWSWGAPRQFWSWAPR